MSALAHRILSVLVAVQSFGFSHAQSMKGLFESEGVLNLTLSGDIRELMQERDTDAGYHAMTLSYSDNGATNVVPLRARVRGHFRRMKGNCTYPPLLLNFSDSSNLAMFDGLDKIKLVTPCRGEKYVVNEYLVYKLYNLVTDKSLKARLAKVVYHDTIKNKSTEPLFGILLEEDDALARRQNNVLIEKKSVRPEQTNRQDFLKMSVFEYLIGNTDWSVQYLQNIKLIAGDSSAIPTTVAYDFDHAGIVRAPYAKPAEELALSSTIIRRYRGYCVEDMAVFNDVFTLFNDLKPKIYDVYTSCAFLDPSYKKMTVKYLDDFYDTINDPKRAATAFLYPCEKDGTGNVVIKGLREN
ncbi:MAG TPA: hypothetical protein VK666_14080 [Chryseolinea sp.]|nr:hypothetical protein [Chryseolinea sp.]